MPWVNTYTNAAGESVILRFTNNEVHGYEFDADVDLGLISKWQEKPKEFSYNIVTTSLAERERIQDVLMYDSVNSKYGVLSFDGWSVNCRVKKLEWTNWQLEYYCARASIDFVSPEGYWHRTTVLHVESGASSGAITTGLDLPADFEFDFAGTSILSTTRQLDTQGSKFAVGLRFYGPCSNPYSVVTVTTADGTQKSNRYGLSASASAGEQLVVDPFNRNVTGEAIYLRLPYGKKQNMYSSRVRGVEGCGTYIWQELPPGHVTVTVPQDIVADISVIEKTVIPPWN